MIQVFKIHCAPLILLLCVALLPLGASSQDILVEGPDVTITTADVLADVQRLPAETRKTMLARPDSLSQLASGLYQRRALAAQAEQTGVGADPQTQASIRIGRDRVLSDALLARIDKAAVPEDAALDALALNTYRVKPERFHRPEEIRVRHILLRGTDNATRAKANELLAQLRQGADFATLARQQSADAGSAARGGDLGFFARSRMVPAFEAAAFALKKPGDLSAIVETNFGLHIIRLEERHDAGIRPFDEVKDELRKEISAGLIKAAREQEVKRLLSTARFNDAAFQALSDTQR